MTRKQIKEKTAYSPASYVTTPCAILLQYTM